MDRQTDGQTDGRTDRRTDRQTDRQLNQLIDGLFVLFGCFKILISQVCVCVCVRERERGYMCMCIYVLVCDICMNIFNVKNLFLQPDNLRSSRRCRGQGRNLINLFHFVAK
jgi:hypothetical protein